MCHKLGLESSFLYEVLDLDNLRTVFHIKVIRKTDCYAKAPVSFGSGAKG